MLTCEPLGSLTCSRRRLPGIPLDRADLRGRLGDQSTAIRAVHPGLPCFVWLEHEVHFCVTNPPNTQSRPIASSGSCSYTVRPANSPLPHHPPVLAPHRQTGGARSARVRCRSVWPTTSGIPRWRWAALQPPDAERGQPSVSSHRRTDVESRHRTGATSGRENGRRRTEGLHKAGGAPAPQNKEE